MRGQPKWLSLLETALGVLIGFAVALILQLIVFPLFDITTTTSENLQIAAIFTVASIIKGYFVRRFFNWLHVKEKELKWVK